MNDPPPPDEKEPEPVPIRQLLVDVFWWSMMIWGTILTVVALISLYGGPP